MTEAGFDSAQSAGFFVGVRQFKDSRIIEVPFAVDDAVDLAYLFTLELHLIDPRRVTLALSGEPKTPKSAAHLRALLAAGSKTVPAEFMVILDRLDAALLEAGSQGIFVASFATHGYMLGEKGEAKLFARDSMRSRLDATGLSVSDLLNTISKSELPRCVVLLDACRERVDSERGLAEDANAAMSQAFAEAIANAEGLAVLSASTRGGYSYDDPKLGNGVFTANVIAGLHGAAPPDERGYVTLATLVPYVDTNVRSWVKRNRPEHQGISKGITQDIDVSALTLPLAVNPKAMAGYQEAAARREKLLGVLRQNQHRTTISGAMVDEITDALENANAERAKPLLMQLEILQNMGPRYRAEFARWWTSVGMKDIASNLLPPGFTSVGPAKDPASGLPMRIRCDKIGYELVPAGEFVMGETGVAEPAYHAYLGTFYIGVTEVTNEQFRKFRPLHSSDTSDGNSLNSDNQPVVNVRWEDAKEFCDWAGLRLPTEVQWEKAARGTDGRKYPWGNQWPPPKGAGNFRLAGHEDIVTAPVATYGSSEPYGTRDMAGNVYEWCAGAEGDFAVLANAMAKCSGP